MRERGEPVVNMGIGEPKNKTPITAILSSAARLSGGDVKYTPPEGMPSLRKAIIRYTEENYDRVVAPENVIVSAGAKQSLFNILYSLLNPQDEVIILAPHWVSYPEIVKMVYGIPVIVTPEDGKFIPRMQEIEQAVTSYTKAIIVNSPNNPSGAVFPPELIAEIVEFCERKKIYLIMDDIYHKLVFDGTKAAPAYQFTKKDVEDTMVIVVNGVAKLYGMTGFRIGWVIANRSLVEVMTNVQSQVTSCTSSVLQAAAEGALTGMQNVVENLRLTFQNNRNVICQELRVLQWHQNDQTGWHFLCPAGFPGIFQQLGRAVKIKAIDVFRQIESLPFARESSDLFDRPSINLGRIVGGDALNRVPDACAIDVDIRYLPGPGPRGDPRRRQRPATAPR